MRLFDTPAIEPAHSDYGTVSMGASAEMLLVARLLELRHRVALPVADDDGVDLIVNYRTLVQVKSSACRLADGTLGIRLRKRSRGQRIHCIPEHVDVVAIYARDSRTWWFIPGEAARESSSINLSEHSIKSKYDAHREAWNYFDGWGGDTSPRGAASPRSVFAEHTEAA